MSPSKSSLSKSSLRAELVAKLAADLEALERVHHATIEGATHEEAKPENDKDTRALERSYLARGQAARIEELRAAVAETNGMPLRDFADRPAALGALVTVEEDGKSSTLLLAPSGGGEQLAGGAVQVVTPKSPLGRAVLGKRTGDEAELVVAGKTRTLEIARVE